MKYTQEEFENICRPLSHGLNVDLTLGPKDSYDLRSLSRLCANRITRRLDWGVLGARIALQIIRSTAGKTFSDATEKLEIYLNKDYYNFVLKNKDVLDSIPNEEKSDNKQAISIGTLETNYLLKYNKCKSCKKDCPECERFYVGETPEQMYMRIATFLCMPDIEMIKTCYHYLSDQKYSHATPTMYNAGCVRPQMASCFVLSVQDSLWSIEDYWTYVGEISRNSGGIGLDTSNIRHSYIGNAGKSDGVPALLNPFESILNYVDQSKKRKGSAAIFLSIWHIDIQDFINLKVPVGTSTGSGADDKNKKEHSSLFYSVWVQDLFMKRVENDEDWTLFCPKRCPGLTEVWGDEFEKMYLDYEASGRGLKKLPARKILQGLYLAQCKTGQPYICVADRFNQSNMQENIGIIRSSNLCVAPDTMILTDHGYFPIASLWGQHVNVWNGFEWSRTRIEKTGYDQKMCRVDFSNGASLTCTDYHKFYIDNDTDVQCVHANELRRGMKIIRYLYPIVSHFEDDTNTVPINASSEIKLEWLKEVFLRFGKLSKKNNMHIKSSSKDILLQIQLLLHTMGCNPQVVANRNGTFRLVIFARDLYILGFIDGYELLPYVKENPELYITNITELEEHSDTYCFTESKRGMGIFNGILTGQCSEISLHTSEKEIASCNLASLCLGSFVHKNSNGETVFNYDEFSTVVRFVVRVMNNVIDRNYYPERIDQIKYANFKNRPLGLGIQGLANVYAHLELMFDSKEAREINNRIIQTMYYSAIDESSNIAIEKGESYPAFPGSPYSLGVLHPDLWKAPDGTTAKFLEDLDFPALREKVKRGMYNSTLLALMPTASSSIIAEQTPCFEPFNFIIGSKTLISGQYTHVCRDFAEDMEKLGVWSEEFAKEIINNELGSLAGLKIPDSIKDKPLKVARWNFLMDKYRTAYEIGPKASILQGIDRTPFVCQSQSLNWFVPKPSWKKFLKYVLQSWRKGAKTIVYYNRGTSSMSARPVATCTSCTG